MSHLGENGTNLNANFVDQSKDQNVKNLEKTTSKNTLPILEKFIGPEVAKKADILISDLSTTLSDDVVDRLTLDDLTAAINVVIDFSKHLSAQNKSLGDTLLLKLTNKKESLSVSSIDKKTTIESLLESDKKAALELFENGPEHNFDTLWASVHDVSKSSNLTGIGEQTEPEKQLRKLVVAYCKIKGVDLGSIKLRRESITSKPYIEVTPKSGGSEVFKISWKGEQIKQVKERISHLSLKEGVEKQFNDIIQQFGSALISIFEFLGGKGALKSLCEKFKIPTDTIERLYDSTYKLAPDQITTLTTVYTSADDSSFANRVAKGPDGKDRDFTPTIVEAYYAKQEWLEPNFNLLDPVLVDRAMKKNPNIAVANLVVPSGSLYGETTYKINQDIALTFPQKKAIFDELVHDSSLWNNVNNLSAKGVSASVYGKNTLDKDQQWNTKIPQTPKQKAIVFGACLMKGSRDMKYVLSQTPMPYEQENAKAIKASEQEKPNNTTSASADIDIQKDWTSVFDKCSGAGARSAYPLTPDGVTKLTTESMKQPYEEYKNRITANISKLLDPNKKDVTLVEQQKIKPFLMKHFSVYLYRLKQDPLYKDLNHKKAIDAVISKFDGIKKDLSIDISALGIVIHGKDATDKPIVLDTPLFSWLPKKAEAQA